MADHLERDADVIVIGNQPQPAPQTSGAMKPVDAFGNKAAPVSFWRPGQPSSPGSRFEFGDDPTRYILNNDQFARPSLTSGTVRFVWPGGIEGFELRGTAELGVHKYIAVGDIDAEVIFPNESRVTMTGTFPGHTGVGNMRALERVILAQSGDAGKRLWLPYIFPEEQMVHVTDWNFNHEADDRTRSIGYSLSFIVVGKGAKRSPNDLDDPTANPTFGTIPPPAGAGKPKGTGHRYVTTDSTHRTLRSLAAKVYKDPNKWRVLLDKNTRMFSRYLSGEPGMTMQKLAYHALPLGMSLEY